MIGSRYLFIVTIAAIAILRPSQPPHASYPNVYYYPETIDSLLTLKSAHSHVAVRGKVGAITSRQDAIITFRLVDEHGHSIACILPPDKPQPRFGVEILVSGVRNQFTVPGTEPGVTPDRTVVEIDPVEIIEDL